MKSWDVASLLARGTHSAFVASLLAPRLSLLLAHAHSHLAVRKVARDDDARSNLVDSGLGHFWSYFVCILRLGRDKGGKIV